MPLLKFHPQECQFLTGSREEIGNHLALELGVFPTLEHDVNKADLSFIPEGTTACAWFCVYDRKEEDPPFIYIFMLNEKDEVISSTRIG